MPKRKAAKKPLLCGIRAANGREVFSLLVPSNSSFTLLVEGECLLEPASTRGVHGDARLLCHALVLGCADAAGHGGTGSGTAGDGTGVGVLQDCGCCVDSGCRICKRGGGQCQSQCSHHRPYCGGHEPARHAGMFFLMLMAPAVDSHGINIPV